MKLKDAMIEVNFFRQNIRNVRTIKRMSQKDMASICKLSQSTIAQIESGRKFPSLKTAIKITCALDMYLSDMLSRKLELNWSHFRKSGGHGI